VPHNYWHTSCWFQEIGNHNEPEPLTTTVKLQNASTKSYHAKKHKEYIRTLVSHLCFDEAFLRCFRFNRHLNTTRINTAPLIFLLFSTTLAAPTSIQNILKTCLTKLCDVIKLSKSTAIVKQDRTAAEFKSFQNCAKLVRRGILAIFIICEGTYELHGTPLSRGALSLTYRTMDCK